MRLKINKVDRDPFWVEAEPYYTVEVLKKQIEYLYCIPYPEQHLVHDSRNLFNNEYLSELNIKNGDSLTLELLSGRFLLNCQMTKIWSIDYHVYSNTTIEKLKNLVFDCSNISPRIQRLFLGDIELEDKYPLSHYDIDSESKLVVKYNLDLYIENLNSLLTSLQKINQMNL